MGLLQFALEPDKKASFPKSEKYCNMNEVLQNSANHEGQLRVNGSTQVFSLVI